MLFFTTCCSQLKYSTIKRHTHWTEGPFLMVLVSQALPWWPPAQPDPFHACSLHWSYELVMAEWRLALLVDWQRLVQILKLHHLTAMKNPWSRNVKFLQCLLSLKRIWQKTILHNLVRLMLLFLMNHFRLCLEVRRGKRIKFPASDSSFCLRKENFGTSTRHSLGIRCWQWASECPSSPACENRKCCLCCRNIKRLNTLILAQYFKYLCPGLARC